MRLSRLFKVLSLLIVVTLACQCSGAGIVPTAQPAASPTPRVPYAPIVGDHFPAKGDELPVNGSVDVYFDQPMDQASVAAAFSISPTVTGTFTWLDDSTVRFTPTTQLERASRYTVTVGGDAKSKDGLPMGAPYTFNADTVGFLEVTQVLPAPDTQQVEVNSAITVMFNRPVVALGLTGQTGALPNPLTLDPPVPGAGEWLNTSIFVFHPQKPLAGSATYHATIKGGLTDTTGGLLKDDFSWTFSTLPPAVVNVEPTYGALDVSLTQPISATFNQPMDIVSTQGAFSLNDAGGSPAPGSFKWNDDHTVMTFTPQGQLRLGAAYTAALSTAARAADGQTPLADALTWTFNTVLYPAVLNTDPGNGARVDTYYGFRVFFASPMDEKTLAKNIAISPDAKVGSTYYSDSDKSYYISFDFAPSTQYTVTLGPDMADPYGNRIGVTTTVTFTTRPYEPLFQFNTRGDVGLYSAYTPTSLYVTYRNFDNLHFSFYRMTTGDFAKWTGADGYSFRQGYHPTDRIRDWTVSPQQFLNESAYLKVPLTEDGSALPPGLYYLRADGPGGYPIEHALVVSKYNLTLKVGFDSALVWATDQQSGRPVAGLPVTLYDETFKPLASGNTDSDGLFRAGIDPSAMPNLWTVLNALSPAGDSFAAVQSQWSTGVDAWDFNQTSNYYPRTDTTYLYTDRPVYRPGQVVSFRGIARAEHDARFTLPDLGGIDVTIANDQGEKVYTKTLPLSPYGAFADQFTLSDAAGTGNYNINTTTGDNRYQANLSFQVAEYHKPEFLVNVTADEPAVVQGDTIHAHVESTFFFGGPVSNANVQWTLLAANSFFQYNGRGYYDFTDFDYTSGEGTPYYGSFGEVIASGTGVTDGQGKLAINVPADIGKKTASQLFTLEATVTDINGQSVSGRTSVTVHQGDFYVGIGPDQFVGQAGQPSKFNLLTVGWDGEPHPGRQVKVTYYRHEWFNVQEQDEFGNKVWTWSAKDTQVAEDTVTTGADGKAVSSFTPAAGGTYRAVATAADSGGRTVRSASYIWVTSGEFISWRQDNNNRIALVPDRKLYHPGDTAEILIPSPFQGETQALLTVERGGIYKTERLTLTSNSTVYQLPITSDYAPDVYVSVVIVKGVDDTNPAPAFRAGLAHLKVSPEEQQLTVTVTPDKTKVGPRDTVTYKVHAADHNGQPVQAELSAGLADLAALSLAAPNSGPILDAFYGERGLSVRTAVGLTLSVDQLNTQTAAIKGGGGGAESGFVVVRGDFRDTAYWNPSVVTDANGDASVSIKLPDNLTTWRLDVRGVTADTLVGQNTVDIVATKDLLIRPATPRFFVVGDQAELAAVVNNNTANDLTVDVTLSGSGFTLADPAKQTVAVKANDRARVQWSATIADAPAADLTFTAVSGDLSDASKPPLGNPPDQLLPIYKYSAPETVATAGVLDGQSTATELIALPRRYDASQGRLSVELSPSLAAGMTAGLDYLEHYPYECTEQTISRFLPNVLTYRALQKLGISDPALEARLTSLVNAGAQRLYSKQHPDGGWGWWVTDESNAFITAYALFGLNRAKEAGFNITQSVLDNGAQFLRAQIKSPNDLDTTWKLNRQAFMVYALADSGASVQSEAANMVEARARMDTYAKAFLALALHKLDPNDTRIPTLLSDIRNGAILSATGAHWEEANRDMWNMGTNTRSTAIVLSAMATLDPGNGLNPNVVRWLMTARNATGAWASTQETAWALIGLTDWMETTGELKAGYDYTVSLNGGELKAGSANADNLRDPVQLSVAVKDLVKDQANRLVLGRTAGDGRMYYTAHLTVYQDVKDVKAQNKGIIVARKYTLPNGDCGGPRQPACPAVTSAAVGQDVKVTVTIIAPTDLYYVMVEDPIPAGAEPVDTSLLTTSVVGQAPQLNSADPLYYGWGWWWFSNTDIRDEKLAMFATYLPRGTYEYTYTLHASLAGTYNVIPTTANEFYEAEVSGRGDGSVFTVNP